jgi:hypothetical protein
MLSILPDSMPDLSDLPLPLHESSKGAAAVSVRSAANDADAPDKSGEGGRDGPQPEEGALAVATVTLLHDHDGRLIVFAHQSSGNEDVPLPPGTLHSLRLSLATTVTSVSSFRPMVDAHWLPITLPLLAPSACAPLEPHSNGSLFLLSALGATPTNGTAAQLKELLDCVEMTRLMIGSKLYENAWPRISDTESTMAAVTQRLVPLPKEYKEVRRFSLRAVNSSALRRWKTSQTFASSSSALSHWVTAANVPDPIDVHFVTSWPIVLAGAAAETRKAYEKAKSAGKTGFALYATLPDSYIYTINLAATAASIGVQSLSVSLIVQGDMRFLCPPEEASGAASIPRRRPQGNGEEQLEAFVRLSVTTAGTDSSAGSATTQTVEGPKKEVFVWKETDAANPAEKFIVMSPAPSLSGLLPLQRVQGKRGDFDVALVQDAVW